MTDIITFSPVIAVDANGLPVANAQAEFFDTGTTTPATVYQDAGEATPHASPLVADGNGAFPAVFKSGSSVKVVVKTPLGATLYTIDPAVKVPSSGSSAGAVSFVATAEIPQTDVQAAIEQVQTNVEDNLASPAFTGTPTAPTAAGGTDTTQLATTAFVRGEIPAETDLTVSPDAALRRDIGKAYVDGFTSTAQTITSAGQLTLAHGMARAPRIVSYRLVCTDAGGEAGYSQDDEVIVDANNSGATTGRITTAKVDATNIVIRFANATEAFSIAHATTGVPTALTNSKWDIYVEGRY